MLPNADDALEGVVGLTPAVVKASPLEDPLSNGLLPNLWSCDDRPPDNPRGDPKGKGEYGDCLGGGEEPSLLMTQTNWILRRWKNLAMWLLAITS